MSWIVILALLLLLVGIISAIIFALRRKKGDYGDGGGIMIAGGENTSSLEPNEKAGLWGEKTANYYLRLLLRNDEYILINMLLPVRGAQKTEVDCVLVSRKGIFCIETKYWVGHIGGSDDDECWYQKYDDPCMADKKLHNPVKQNEGHCIILESLLNNKYQVDNVVIFVALEDGWEINSQYTFTINEFEKYYRTLKDDELSLDEIKQIGKKLSLYVASPEELAKHKEDIRKRFNNGDA